MKWINAKKAQFYIFTAVLLSVVAFTMVKPRETPLQRDNIFKELHQNYIKESAKAVDNAILDGVDLKERFEDFNGKFKVYSNSRSINFGFLGILGSEEIIIHNKMNREVMLIYPGGSEGLGRGSSTVLNWSAQIQVVYNDVNYDLYFTEGLTEVKGIFYAKGSDYEKVYVYS